MPDLTLELQTFRAEADQLQHVVIDPKTGSLLNFFDQRRQILGPRELHHLLAGPANQMMPMRQFRPYVTMAAILEMDSADELHIRQ